MFVIQNGTGKFNDFKGSVRLKNGRLATVFYTALYEKKQYVKKLLFCCLTIKYIKPIFLTHFYEKGNKKKVKLYVKKSTKGIQFPPEGSYTKIDIQSL